MAVLSQIRVTKTIPPHFYFLISAVFHYLGPSFAVLLFQRVDILGVAWIRIASAALVFAVWRRPWRLFLRSTASQRSLLIALGIVLALMNACFYEAISRLPLSTVGAIEFIGPITLAAFGIRSWRNVLALLFAIAGVWLLTDIRLSGQPLGFLFAFANCGFFMAYIMLGHQIAKEGSSTGIDRLGMAMIIASLTITPLGISQALPALVNPQLLLSGIGVGICSSVIPYICDQLAMARLPRETFALLLALLPAAAVIIGLVVLGQIPTWLEALGIGLVVCGVLLHRERNLPSINPEPIIIEPI